MRTCDFTDRVVVKSLHKSRVLVVMCLWQCPTQQSLLSLGVPQTNQRAVAEPQLVVEDGNKQGLSFPARV